MISASSLEALRDFLRDGDVWVSIDVDVARALFNTLQEENPTPWIEEETPTTENVEETVPSSLSTPQLPLKPVNQPPPQANRSVNQPPSRSVNQPLTNRSECPHPRSYLYEEHRPLHIHHHRSLHVRDVL